MFELKCPVCKSSNFRIRQVYKTKNNGERKLYFCRDCKESFAETRKTPAAGIVTPLSRVAEVLRARSEGMGFNACCRTFRLGQDTLNRWETRFSALKETLFAYSLCHTFLSQIIEGDELYTKVKENRAPKKSEGWTIVLMERSTRFIWHMQCGEPSRKLFKKAIRTFTKIVEKADSVTLITDGERRYGNLLFEVCYELIKSGKRGRPKKLLRRV